MARALKAVAVAMAAGFIAWAVYDKFVAGVGPGDMAYHAGNQAFEDGLYERAAQQYRAALKDNPEHIEALRGLARSLHLAGQHEQALAVYDEAIARTPEQPENDDERAALAATYANRGILLDTMGRHEAALADYDKALALDPEVARGPNWLTRFLRNQPEAPPTIADRAAYLRAELAKPEGERLLRVPEIDQQQRPYEQ
ncbi:MAG TPA: tetratricopeptide repeat protein [Alphaproteobacteria bacterium]|nr:tetratricopeptide repeat protein [Alphaproteobacteria bacterium]